MDLGFHGEVADFYQHYRRGYPPPVIDALADAFGLTGEDIVVDLGCGTGQLPPPDQRPQFAGQIRAALAGHAPYTEHVEVSLVFGTVSAAAGG